MKNILKCVLLLLILLFPNIIFCQFAVIVNKNVNVRSLSKEKIIDIYTLSTQNWNDGIKIVVIDIKGDNEIKDSFYNYLDFPFSKMQKVWLRKQFSGSGMPPQTVHSFREVLDKISSTSGAIGYIPANLVNKEITVVAIINN